MILFQFTNNLCGVCVPSDDNMAEVTHLLARLEYTAFKMMAQALTVGKGKIPRYELCWQNATFTTQNRN